MLTRSIPIRGATNGQRRFCESSKPCRCASLWKGLAYRNRRSRRYGRGGVRTHGTCECCLPPRGEEKRRYSPALEGLEPLARVRYRCSALAFRAAAVALGVLLCCTPVNAQTAHTKHTAASATDRQADQAGSTRGFSSWLSDPRTYLSVPGAFGLGGLLGFMLKRYFERHDKRTDAVPRLRFHLQRLEKRMLIAYDHPGFDSGEDDFVPLIDDLREAALGCAGLFGKRKGDIIVAALESVESEGRYLSSQRNRALTITSSTEIKAAARRALLRIYDARDALKDKATLLRPSDPENRGLWTPGAPISRIQ
jgi:hypothetical protein